MKKMLKKEKKNKESKKTKLYKKTKNHIKEMIGKDVTAVRGEKNPNMADDTTKTLPTIAVCVSLIYGSIIFDRIKHFVQFYRANGVHKIYGFYEQSWENDTNRDITLLTSMPHTNFTKWWRDLPEGWKDSCDDWFKPEKLVGYKECVKQATEEKYDWLLNIDLDEFLYWNHPSSSLRHFLSAFGNQLSQISFYRVFYATEICDPTDGDEFDFPMKMICYFNATVDNTPKSIFQLDKFIGYTRELDRERDVKYRFQQYYEHGVMVHGETALLTHKNIHLKHFRAYPAKELCTRNVSDEHITHQQQKDLTDPCRRNKHKQQFNREFHYTYDHNLKPWFESFGL